MITPSRKIFYTVEAVLYIAYNAAQGPISSKEIAEKQGLPPRYLEHIMQKLVRAGILRGVRGPRGGYLLAKERRRISVADICDVLEQDREEGEEQPPSTPLGTQVVAPLWQRIHEAIMADLKQITLADLCEQAAQKDIRKNLEERFDFTI